MVDALASGASVLRDVEVRVFSRVPKEKAVRNDCFFFWWHSLELSSAVNRALVNARDCTLSGGVFLLQVGKDRCRAVEGHHVGNLARPEDVVDTERLDDDDVAG